MTTWTKTTDTMPKTSRAVLVVCETSYGSRRIINRAMWVAAKTEESSPESEIGVYDEETDTYYDPEGWYELISHWADFSAIGMSGVTVTHWMPLPEFPKD